MSNLLFNPILLSTDINYILRVHPQRFEIHYSISDECRTLNSSPSYF